MLIPFHSAVTRPSSLIISPKMGHLKQNGIRSTASTWYPHDGHTQYLKTSPKIIPLSFYIFEDSTRPFRLISYSTSIHLGIIEFKVPKETSSHVMVNSITNSPPTKHASFSDPLHYSNAAKKSPTKK